VAVGCVLAASLPAAAALRQGVDQADLQVQTIDLTLVHDHVSVRVVISNGNDRSARNAALHLFVPVGAIVARVPPGCRPSPSPVRTAPARVDCDLGELRIRDLREMVIVTTAPPPGGEGLFATLVYSDTPDPAMKNNYRTARLTAR
jgi:hypothetical protein